jgi:hypothetical protein
MNQRKKHLISKINDGDYCYSKQGKQCHYLRYSNQVLTCSIRYTVHPELPEDRKVLRPDECKCLERFRK